MLKKKVICKDCGESYPDGWPHTCSESTGTPDSKDIKLITPKDNYHLEWLLKDAKNGLHKDGLSYVVRSLVGKVNELTTEVNRLKSSQ